MKELQALPRRAHRGPTRSDEQFPRFQAAAQGIPVAFDARYITGDLSGIGQMCLEVLRGLAGADERLTFRVLVNDRTDLPEDLRARDNLLFCRAPWDPRSLANQLFLPGLLRRLQVKVLHTVDCFGPVAARGVAQIITIHDLIPLLCREMLVHSKKARFPLVWKSWLRLQCARAARVVTVSNHSAGDIARLLRVEPSKLSVIYNPVPEWGPLEPAARFRQRLRIRGRVISSVGREEPYKNLAALIRALPLVLDRVGGDVHLVIAGSSDARYTEARQEVCRLGLEDRVLFAGYLPRASLGTLYRTSKVFIFPSLYEGFGIPPVEAMHFGTPVVAGRRAAVPEILGDAALYVDPEDPRAIAASIVRILENPVLARHLGQAGIRRAARYSLVRAAAQYRRLYDDLLLERMKDEG